MGLPPISTIGFGRTTVSSLILVPMPPASRITFILRVSLADKAHVLGIHMETGRPLKCHTRRYVNKIHRFLRLLIMNNVTMFAGVQPENLYTFHRDSMHKGAREDCET